MSRKAVSAEEALKGELLPGQSVELLKSLHILTREGHLNADTRRKLKQVNHLYRLLEPFLAKGIGSDSTLVDLGSGKSYLGFILYDLFFKEKGVGKVINVEARSELVAKGRETADALHFERMEFIPERIQAASMSKSLPARVTWTTALHACDTATDDAIDFALSRKSDFIALVPCCQAALAEELKSANIPGPISELWSHPIHRREFGSHLTNVLRRLRLEAAGYKVTVTELVGWEHSVKNELILAERKGDPQPERISRLKEELVLFPIGEHWRSRFLSLT